MQVNIIEEAGYNSALYGFSLSYKDRAIPREEWWDFRDCEECSGDSSGFSSCKECKKANEHTVARVLQTTKTATANAGRGMGHDKWLRQVVLWVDIEAPRYWWSEFDTYKVGTVAQSESTMHTLSRRKLTTQDFQDGNVASVYFVNHYYPDFKQMKKHLPESYLQRRVVSLNYAVLRCIIEQRKNHKLPEWKTLIDALYAQCEHPELLPRRD